MTILAYKLHVFQNTISYVMWTIICFIKSYRVISLFDDRNKEKEFRLRSWSATVNIRRYLLAILFRVQWTAEPSEQEKLEALGSMFVSS